MASSLKFLLLLIASFAIVKTTLSGDPDILTDFVTPLSGKVDGKYFTYTALRSLFSFFTIPPKEFKVTKVSMAEFPALNGQSVSFAVLQYPNGTINPPHTHPRASELLFLLSGCLEVGFVDTSGKLYTQKLEKGDLFVFPKGLVHWQFNPDKKRPAMAVSGFGSASAGVVSLPTTLFTTGIDSNILAKSFKTDLKTIVHLELGLIPFPWK